MSGGLRLPCLGLLASLYLSLNFIVLQRSIKFCLVKIWQLPTALERLLGNWTEMVVNLHESALDNGRHCVMLSQLALAMFCG